MNLNLKLFGKDLNKVVVVLLIISIAALVFGEGLVEKTISLEDVLTKKAALDTPSDEVLEAMTSLEKTKVSHYPNLSGSGRVSKQQNRDTRLSHSYSISWNTPIGMSMQLKYLPEPQAQENALSFSVSTQLIPLPIYSNGLINLDNAAKNLERAKTSEKQKIFLDELTLYLNFRKIQIQQEKLYLNRGVLDDKAAELEAAKLDFDKGLISKRDLEDADLQYRNAHYQYLTARLNFDRQWTDFSKELGLDPKVLPERLVNKYPKYPKISWDEEKAISLARQNSPEVFKAKEALIAAERTVASDKFDYVSASAGLNYNIKDLEKISDSNWSVNLSVSFNTDDLFFNFSREENMNRYREAKKNYDEIVLKVATDLIRMKEDLDLNLYQVQNKELSYQRILSDLEIKKLQFEAGSLKETEYIKAEQNAYESYLDFLETMINFEVAANKAMFTAGVTERMVILN